MLVVVVAGLLGTVGCARFRPPRGVQPRVVTMLATGYCRCGSCCGWKRNWRFRPVYASGSLKGRRKRVGVTAWGTKAKPGTIAADTRKFPFGTIMHIEGYGYGRVEDRGGAIKGDHIDLFFRTHRQALAWGKQTRRVKVWVPK
jgi:3D (Asp-Asp-Asp) domain-containing protein